LRIGHRPLLELTVLGADHQHQAAGADQRLLLLDGDADVHLIGRHADDIGVLQEIDAIRQQKTEAASATADRCPGSQACGSRTASDDPSAIIAIGLGSSYSKRTLAGLLDVKVTPWSCCRRVRPGRNFRPGFAATTGRNSPWRLAPSDWHRSSQKDGGNITARIGNHRGRAAGPGLSRSSPGPSAGPRRSSGSRGLWRRFRNRHGRVRQTVLRRNCAEDGVATLATDTAIRNAKPARRPGTANCSVIRIFGFLFNASSRLVMALLSCFGTRRYRFSVKKYANSGNTLGRMAP